MVFLVARMIWQPVIEQLFLRFFYWNAICWETLPFLKSSDGFQFFTLKKLYFICFSPFRFSFLHGITGTRLSFGMVIIHILWYLLTLNLSCSYSNFNLIFFSQLPHWMRLQQQSSLGLITIQHHISPTETMPWSLWL